jgi:hypothetical protein
MLAIPLSPVANQSVSFNADGVLWTVHVYQAVSHMCADISKNGVKIVDGVRCFGGIPLMQYSYMYAPNLGNFCFDSDADWTNFGNSCNLYYMPQDELAEFLDALQQGVI